MRRFLAHLVLLCAAVGVVAGLTGPPVWGARAGTGHPLLPRPQLLKVLGAGHLNFVADLYWLQLLQQVGVSHSADEYLAIADYANLVADLDPRFRSVYLMAGLTIPYNRGREEWVNGDAALAILERGLKVFPDDLTLWLYHAHTCMFVLRDYRRAAESLKKVAQLPGAPKVAGLLATRVMAQAGEFDAALEFAQVMEQTAADPNTREYFEHRKKEIQLERVLSKVDAATMQYWRREGALPGSLDALLAAKDLDAPPVDPLGGTITLDSFGRARSTSAPFRLELYDAESKMLAPRGPGGLQHSVEPEPP